MDSFYRRWLPAAFKFACKTKDHPLREIVVAILIRGGNIIAMARNGKRFKPGYSFTMDGCVHSLHAELDLLSKVDTSGGTILVYRFNQSDIRRGLPPSPRLSKPCPRCQRRLDESNHSRLIYAGELGEVAYA